MSQLSAKKRSPILIKKCHDKRVHEFAKNRDLNVCDIKKSVILKLLKKKVPEFVSEVKSKSAKCSNCWCRKVDQVCLCGSACSCNEEYLEEFDKGKILKCSLLLAVLPGNRLYILINNLLYPYQ